MMRFMAGGKKKSKKKQGGFRLVLFLLLGIAAVYVAYQWLPERWAIPGSLGVVFVFTAIYRMLVNAAGGNHESVGSGKSKSRSRSKFKGGVGGSTEEHVLDDQDSLFGDDHDSDGDDGGEG